MRTVPELLRRRLKLVIRQNDAVAQAFTLDNMRRLVWLGITIVPLNLAHVALFTWFGSDHTLSEKRWAIALVKAHSVMAATIALVALSAYWAGRQNWSHQARTVVQVFAILATLLFMTTIVAIDQMVTTNITPFLIGNSLLGVVLLIRPLVATLVFSWSYLLFFAAMGMTPLEPAQLLTDRANGLTAVALGLLISITFWRKNTTTLLLQREIEMSHAALNAKQRELEQLALRDPLTGLYNRTEFQRITEIELVRARRARSDTSLLVADLDFFKTVNDRFGHPVGDLCLKHLAGLIVGSLRASDVVARLGGEEFIILLPQTSLDAAKAIAEKLRNLVEATPAVADAYDIPMTMSIGVSTLTFDSDGDYDRLYSAADRALYASKQAGRNRVEFA